MGTYLPDQSRIHETPAHRQRQQDILRIFAERYDLTFSETEFLSRQDCKLYMNGVYTALVEVKCRHNRADAYKLRGWADYTIDASKVDSLVAAGAHDGVAPILVVSWQGDVRWLNVAELHTWLQESGTSFQQRRDRDELADPVYHIPVVCFYEITEDTPLPVAA